MEKAKTLLDQSYRYEQEIKNRAAQDEKQKKDLELEPEKKLTMTKDQSQVILDYHNSISKEISKRSQELEFDFIPWLRSEVSIKFDKLEAARDLTDNCISAGILGLFSQT